jgi:hypothetical protein
MVFDDFRRTPWVFHLAKDSKKISVWLSSRPSHHKPAKTRKLLGIANIETWHITAASLGMIGLLATGSLRVSLD